MVFSPQISVLFNVVLICLAEICGQSCLKKFHGEPEKFWFFIAAMAFYMCIFYLLIKSYSSTTMGSVNALWSGASVLTIFTAGFLFFEEVVSYKAAIGAVFIVIGMGFISSS
jgi:multidrug transporter EmrE-like cation transporter